MIDENGFRLNVGIILTNDKGQLFWGRRVGQEAWQFPQGGIHDDEGLQEALFRELEEEVGLASSDVSIITESQQWLSYRLPKRLVRSDTEPVCVGQKQKWFLLRLESSNDQIKLDRSIKPEFDDWRWVSYWFPLYQVVAFKREVYRQALLEFAPQIMKIKQKGIALDPLI
ncbi:MAG: RNA pyrophosphohydrolase [Candidatus Berkiellales bacterium]